MLALSISTYFTFLSGVFIVLSCWRYPSQLTSPSSLVCSLFYHVGVIHLNLLHLPLWCVHCFIMLALSISTYSTFLSGVFIVLSCWRYPSQLTPPSSLVCSLFYHVGVIHLNLLHLPLWCVHCFIMLALSISTYSTFLSGVFIVLSCWRYPSQLTPPSSLVCSLFYHVGVIHLNLLHMLALSISTYSHLPLWCVHCFIMLTLSISTYSTFLSGVFIVLSCWRYPSQLTPPSSLVCSLFYHVGVIHLNLLHLPLWCVHCFIMLTLSISTYSTFLSGVFIVLSCWRYPSQLTPPSSLVCSLFYHVDVIHLNLLHLPLWCVHCFIMLALSISTYFTFLSGVFIVLSCWRYPSQLTPPSGVFIVLSCWRYPSQLTSPSSLVCSLFYHVGVIHLNLLHLPLWCVHCFIMLALSISTYSTFLSGVFIVLSCWRYPSQLTPPSSLVCSLFYHVGVIHLNLLHLPLWCVHCFIMLALSISTYSTFLSGVFIVLSCWRYPSQLTPPSSLVCSLFYHVGVIHLNLLHLPLWCVHCFIMLALSISTYSTFLSGVFIVLSCWRYPSQLTPPSSLVCSLFYHVGVIHLNLLHLPLWCVHCFIMLTLSISTYSTFLSGVFIVLSCWRYPSQLTPPSSLVCSLFYHVGVIHLNLLHLPLWCVHCFIMLALSISTYSTFLSGVFIVLSCWRYPSQLTPPSSLVCSLFYHVGVIHLNLLHLPLWCVHCFIMLALSISTYSTFLSGVFIVLSCWRYPSQLTPPSSLVCSLFYHVGVIHLNLLHLPLWCVHCFIMLALSISTYSTFLSGVFIVLSCWRYPSQLTPPSSLCVHCFIMLALSISTYSTFLSGVFIVLSCWRYPSQLTPPSSLVCSLFYHVGVIHLNLLHLPLWCVHCFIMLALSISTYSTFLSGVFIVLSCWRYPSQLTSPSSLVCSLFYHVGVIHLNLLHLPLWCVHCFIMLALSISTYSTFLSGVFIVLSCWRYPSQLTPPSSLVCSLFYHVDVIHLNLLHLPLWCVHCFIMLALSISTYSTFLSGVFIVLSCWRYPSQLTPPSSLVVFIVLSCWRYPSQLTSPSSLMCSLFYHVGVIHLNLLHLPLWCVHCFIMLALSISTYSTFLSGVFIVLSCWRYPSQLTPPSSLVCSLFYHVGVIHLNLLHLPLYFMCSLFYHVGVIHLNLLHLPLWCVHCFIMLALSISTYSTFLSGVFIVLSCWRYPSQLTPPSSLVCSLFYHVGVIHLNLLHLPLWCVHCFIMLALSISTYSTFLSGVFIVLSCWRYPSQLTFLSGVFIVLSCLSISTYSTFLSGVFIVLSCWRYPSQLTPPSSLVCSLFYHVGVIHLNLLHLPLWCVHCFIMLALSISTYSTFLSGVFIVLSCWRYPSQLTPPSSLVCSLFYHVGVIHLNLLHLPLWCVHCFIMLALSISTYSTFLSGVFIVLSCWRYPSQLPPSSLVCSLFYPLSISTYSTFLSGVFIVLSCGWRYPSQLTPPSSLVCSLFYHVGVIHLNLLHLPLWCVHCFISPSSLVCSLALSISTYSTFLSGVFIVLSCWRYPSQLTPPSSLVCSLFYHVGVIHLNLLHLPLWCVHCFIMLALSISTYFTFLSDVFIVLSCWRYPSQLTSPSSLVCSLFFQDMTTFDSPLTWVGLYKILKVY